jgi:hypothetical protein
MVEPKFIFLEKSVSGAAVEFCQPPFGMNPERFDSGKWYAPLTDSFFRHE